jgi:alanine-synthesizing transaminase
MNDAPAASSSPPQRKSIPIQLADRVGKLPPYVFVRINAILADKRKAGKDPIDLGMGNPQDPPAESIVAALAEAAKNPKNHGYSKSVGIDELRREVANKYRRKYGVQLDAENEIIACIGSKEGFSHLCLALMGPGDNCISPAPYFPVHLHAITMASGNVITLDIKDSQKFLSNIAYVCETLTPKPKLLVINYPHNPSSVTVDPEFYVDVVKLAKKHQFMVISDSAYADVAFDGYVPPSFLAAPGACDVGVEFTTMSKGYNMAGWRVGFCAGNSQMVKALASIKGYYDYGIFQAVQIAALAALRDCDADVIAQSKVYQKRRDILCAGLKKLGWQFETPRAGMFVWARYPEKYQGGMSTLDFSLMLLDKADVAVSPGSAFGPAGEGYVRMSLVENETRLAEAINRIGKALP